MLPGQGSLIKISVKSSWMIKSKPLAYAIEEATVCAGVTTLLLGDKQPKRHVKITAIRPKYFIIKNKINNGLED